MEISSLLSGIYIDSQAEDNEDDAPPVVTPVVSDMGRRTSETSSLAQSVQALCAEINTLKENLRTSNESALNCEAVCRDAMNQRFEDIENFMQSSLVKLERGVIECLRRQDEQKEKVVARIMKTSTPKARFSVGTVRSNSERMTVAVPAASYAKPPINLEFPRFGEIRETRDVMEFVEHCEHFLTLRLLSDIELVATLNAVLTGPTRSWWLAERNKTIIGLSLKGFFLRAFLPTDYLIEVEEQLKDMIQGPDQCIRDFAYDYRALCLKWKADLQEEDVVQRILNNCNPFLVGSLRGAVYSVEQLVKVGSMVERFL